MAASPQSQLYFENKAGRIVNEPAGYFRLDYHAGPRTEDEFRALLTHLLRALARTDWNRTLINQQQMQPFTAREQQWMVDEWLPQAVLDGGYRYGAILVADNVFARLAMSSVEISTRHLPHTYRNFTDEAEAIAWLVAQP